MVEQWQQLRLQQRPHYTDDAVAHSNIIIDFAAFAAAAVNTFVGHRNLDIVVFAAAVGLDGNSFVFDNVVRIVAAIVIAFADDDMHRTT